MDKTPRFLITLTAPSCAGKSYLLNYIRAVAKRPRLVSTTTRAPRKGEIEGVDYFFISEEESRAIEEQNGFAELVIYRGVRYGVTTAEYHARLDEGPAFLIVEPNGIEGYAQPAIDAGAKHLKVFIDVPVSVRMERMKSRIRQDIVEHNRGGPTALLNAVNPHLDRLTAMVTEEPNWRQLVDWDIVLDGANTPKANLAIIDAWCQEWIVDCGRP